MITIAQSGQHKLPDKKFPLKDSYVKDKNLSEGILDQHDPVEAVPSLLRLRNGVGLWLRGNGLCGAGKPLNGGHAGFLGNGCIEAVQR